MISHSCSSRNVLSEYYSLDLNDEEVDHLLHIVESGLQRLLWDLVVSTRTKGGCNGGVGHEFACDLSEGDNWPRQQYSVSVKAIHTSKSHPADLEQISNDR